MVNVVRTSIPESTIHSAISFKTEVDGLEGADASALERRARLERMGRRYVCFVFFAFFLSSIIKIFGYNIIIIYI